MEKEKQIIIDVTPEPVLDKKSPFQKHKEEFIAGVEMGFDVVEKGVSTIKQLMQSVGIGR